MGQWAVAHLAIEETAVNRGRGRAGLVTTFDAPRKVSTRRSRKPRVNSRSLACRVALAPSYVIRRLFVFQVDVLEHMAVCSIEAERTDRAPSSMSMSMSFFVPFVVFAASQHST